MAFLNGHSDLRLPGLDSKEQPKRATCGHISCIAILLDALIYFSRCHPALSDLLDVLVDPIDIDHPSHHAHPLFIGIQLLYESSPCVPRSLLA